MATIILPSYIESIHGRAGDTIFYTVAGTQYARAFTHPRNPGTEAQQKNRAAFSQGVKAWQKLSTQEKSLYNRLAQGKPLSGYNLFISMHMRGTGCTQYNPSARHQANVNVLSPSYMLQSTSVSASVLFDCVTIYCQEGARGGNSPPCAINVLSHLSRGAVQDGRPLARTLHGWSTPFLHIHVRGRHCDVLSGAAS